MRNIIMILTITTLFSSCLVTKSWMEKKLENIESKKTFYPEVGYGKIINYNQLNDRQLGVIRVYESPDKKLYDYFVFKPVDVEDAYLGEMVNFSIYIQNGIAYAYNIKLATNNSNQISSHYSFDTHNQYWHPEQPSHRYGHINNNKNVVEFTYRNKDYYEMNLKEYESDIDFTIKEEFKIYAPTEFKDYDGDYYFVITNRDGHNNLLLEIQTDHPAH